MIPVSAWFMCNRGGLVLQSSLFFPCTVCYMHLSLTRPDMALGAEAMLVEKAALDLGYQTRICVDRLSLILD